MWLGGSSSRRSNRCWSLRNCSNSFPTRPLVGGFSTIAYEATAVIHYHAMPDTSASKPEVVADDLAVSTKDGTTDITRTVAVGELTKQMKVDIPTKKDTLPLNGHLPGRHTCRSSTYWLVSVENGPPIGGTGHFRSLLNVHEGPQNISPRREPHQTPTGHGYLQRTGTLSRQPVRYPY